MWPPLLTWAFDPPLPSASACAVSPRASLALARRRCCLFSSGLCWFDAPRFAERDRDRLPRVFDLLAARARAQFAVLEFVHDPSDRLFLRLGLLRRHDVILLVEIRRRLKGFLRRPKKQHGWLQEFQSGILLQCDVVVSREATPARRQFGSTARR